MSPSWLLFVFFLIKTFLTLSSGQSSSCFHLIFVLFDSLINCWYFVTSFKSAPFHINWLINFLRGITWLVWSNWVVEFLLTTRNNVPWQHLATINNSQIIRLASAKQNVVAKTAGDLKHLLKVSTLGII